MMFQSAPTYQDRCFLNDAAKLRDSGSIHIRAEESQAVADWDIPA